MKAGSVFTGIGGGDLGMERAGIETAWQIETDKFCRRVLAARWPKVEQHGDITKVDPRKLSAVDVLHGGFPCQDVSVAGKRAGLAGERSGLFFEFCRLAAALRPRSIVLENVPGLLSSQEGRDMGHVLGTLAELGYGWAYRVLDAQYFGLAQRRQRVFIVGCLGDAARAAEVLFEPDCGEGDFAAGGEAGEDIAYALAASAGHHGHSSPRGDGSDNLVASLSGIGNGGPDDNDAQAQRLVAFNWQSGGDVRLGVSDKPGALSVGQTIAIQDAREVAKDQNGLGISDGPMYTLDGASQHAVGVFPDPRRHDDRHRGEWRDKPSLNTGNNDLLLASGVRRLTPLECERLQGFPDGWTCLCPAQGVTALCVCPDSPRYRALGNAEPPPVVEWIARRLRTLAAGR